MSGPPASAAGRAPRELRRLRRLFLGLRILTRIRPSERQTLFLWAAVVGFLGAWAAIAFKAATSGIQWLLTGRSGDHVEIFRQLDPGYRFAVPVIGALAAGGLLMLSQRFIRRKATDYMEAIALGDGDVPVRSSLARSGAALFSIASGETIGREGPFVQLAAVAASVTTRLRRVSAARRRLLVACGAAAGVGAAYHTPLAGALFVAEIVLGSMAMESLGPLLISSVMAALTVRSIEGAEPLYAYSDFEIGSVREIALYAGLGLLCGAGASLWMRLLKWGKSLFGEIPGPAWLRLTMGGIVVGALAAGWPEVPGNGGSVIRSILANEYTWHFLLLLLGLKIVATVAAFGSGAVGGVFTPSLLLGAITGFLYASVAGMIWPWGPLNAGGFVLVGMGSFLAAAAQAPVTAILMLFEMSLQYEIVLPLMIAGVTGYFTALALQTEGLYAESLRYGPRSVFDRSLASVRVGEVMRPPVRTVALNTRFRDIAAAFLRTGDRELWTVAPDGTLAGVIRLNEVQSFLREPELADTVIAADITSDDAARLAPEMSLPAALERFTLETGDVLPVVDAASKAPVGSVGRADLLLVISELARREGTRGS